MPLPYKRMPQRIANNFIYRRVWNLLHEKDMNAVFLSVGDVGKGKSTGALRIAEDIDPSFNIDRVCFTVTQFLKLVDQGDRNGKLKRGAVIIFDEAAGSRDAIDARDSLSHANKIISRFTTISRAKQLVIIYCSPLLSQIDKRVRLIGVTGILEFIGVDFKKNRGRAGFSWCYAASKMDKSVMPHPRLWSGGIRRSKISLVTIPRPSKELNKAYLKKKKNFIDEHLGMWNKEAQTRETKRVEGHVGFRQLCANAVDIIDKLRDRKGEINPALIRYHLEVGEQAGMRIKAYLMSNYGGIDRP